MPLWRCISCEAEERSQTEPSRCVCGVESSWALVSEGSRSGRERPARSVRLASLRADELERVSSGEPALDKLLGGGWVLGYSALVHGPGGAGKSRLVYRWASRLAPCLVVGLEMDARLTLETARGAGADVGGMRYWPSPGGWRAEADRVRARSVVIDSVSEVGQGAARMARELRDWCHEGARFGWSIAHTNKRGAVLGSTDLQHAPDYFAKVSPLGKDRCRLRFPKSRFCGRGSVVLSLVGTKATVELAQELGGGEC